MASDAPLNWDLFITPGAPIVTDNPAPNTNETFWSRTSSTLIYGKQDAVLVDVPTTWQQGVTLGLWVKDSGKNLKMIYIRHAHGDHWFGAISLLNRFPNVKVIATPAVVKAMHERASPEGVKLWNDWFPGQVPNQIVFAEELPEGNTIDLEGNDLRVVELGHTDIDDTSCLHVPSLGLVIAGDAAYNGILPFIGNSRTLQKRKEWIAALDKIESLSPRALVAGHKRPGADNDPRRIIEETRQFIRDFDKLTETTTSARELYHEILKLYPDRPNTFILWRGALAAKGE